MLLKIKKINFLEDDRIEFIDDCINTRHIKGYVEYTDNTTIIKLEDEKKIYVAHSKKQIIRAEDQDDEEYLVYDFDSKKILKEIEN